MVNILEEPWFKQPFKWYEEETDKYVVTLQMTHNKALDVLAGLYDIYCAFERNDKKRAIEDLNALAVLLIAHAMGRSDEAIEELLVFEAHDNMDNALAHILSEGEGTQNG